MPNGLSGFKKTRVTPQNLEIFAYGVDYPFTGEMLSTWVFGCFLLLF